MVLLMRFIPNCNVRIINGLQSGVSLHNFTITKWILGNLISRQN